MATAADSVFKMTIDGKAVATSDTMSVRRSATAEVFAYASMADAEHRERVAAATRAFPHWRRTPMAERKAALIKAAEIIEANASELTALFYARPGSASGGRASRNQ